MCIRIDETEKYFQMDETDKCFQMDETKTTIQYLTYSSIVLISNPSK